MFPKSFDPVFYKSKNEDLQAMNDGELMTHYLKFGIAEGRYCSEAQEISYFNKINEKFTSCLEICPIYCPVLTGQNVEYFDFCTKEDLKKRAYSLNLFDVVDSIPEIQHVHKSCDFSNISKKFDVILSNHFVDYTKSITSHLKQVESLLNEYGYYIMILSDKRFSGKRHLESSSIADVLQADYDEFSNYLKAVIEHSVFTTEENALLNWQKKDIASTENTLNSNVFFQMKKVLDSFSKNEIEETVPIWKFTPQSFEQIIDALHELGFIKLKVHEVYQTIYGQSEFIVILRNH